MEKILIIEDDWAQRVLYELEISELGYEVILAKDGLDAVEKFRSHRPGLVVLDLRIPDMEGLRALWKLLSTNPSVPVIIHTAYSNHTENPISEAAEAYVVKSSDLTEFKSALQQVLSCRRHHAKRKSKSGGLKNGNNDKFRKIP